MPELGASVEDPVMWRVSSCVIVDGDTATLIAGLFVVPACTGIMIPINKITITIIGKNVHLRFLIIRNISHFNFGVMQHSTISIPKRNSENYKIRIERSCQLHHNFFVTK